MKTEQINIRLDTELVGALEQLAREESLDRATAIRRLLETAIKEWELERAISGYRRGELSLGRASEESGLTQWELIDAVRTAGLAYPLTAEDAERRLEELPGREPYATLPDIPPKRRGVLLVGINPAPVSVAAGHYYQGRLGRRLWRRLEGLGLLEDAVVGAEDDAFARAGHGLTDLVKRPTSSRTELSEDEFSAGAEALRRKVREWKPKLVLFAFAEPARQLLGRDIRPGQGPKLAGIPTFLLSGPYASREEAERIDAELRKVLGASPAGGQARSQRVTAVDIANGRIRFPREAKRFFPAEQSEVEIVLRGTRFRARYDPRIGPDRNRSAVLNVGRERLANLVHPNEVLRVSRGRGGIPRLE
jgi:TDG/mug DNA glycosylase family protein